jgi:RNA polymerase sigma factor (TIGR02999 family)
MASDERETPVGVADLRELIGELRMMARSLLSTESEAHSFTPTALALTALRRAKLSEQDWEEVQWQNRNHFFFCLAQAMRHALIDHARKRKSKGRDKLIYVSPDELVVRDFPHEAEDRPEQILLLEEALAVLDGADERLARVIEQFYFLRYSIPDIARFAKISEKTVDRDLKRARITLQRIMQDLAKP